MERFYQEVGTAYFWISVVGVGTAVGVLSTLITKMAPRLGLSLLFWWRIRRNSASANQSQREKDFRANVRVVESQPALISSFLIRAYALFIFGAAVCVLGVWGFFLDVTVDSVLLYGAKSVASEWWRKFDVYTRVIFTLTAGVQFLKLANQRYLIATIAEERLMERGLEKPTAAASPVPPSAP